MIWEVLDLVARWIHVIAGILWVGNSMLFNWLDRSLQPHGDARAQTPSPMGTIWLLHSGAFYYVEKTLLGGAPMPRPLHWFKWQAYTTWLSGVALLVVVYYLGNRAVLADSGAISHTHAVALSVFGLVVGWSLYEAMNRVVAPRAPRVAAIVWIGGLVLVAIAFTNHLGGRAAFLHVGALLATIMAGNVAMTIVPSQRELVASIAQGRGADPAVSARAKRVSIHNNYFTYPVIALMVSNHFSTIYAHRWNWLLLLLIVGGGAAARHVLNVRFTYAPWKPALAAVIVTTIAAIAGVLSMPTSPAAASTAAVVAPDTVTFADVRHVVDRRCAACHSSTPTDLTFGVAPGGVAFDTPAQIAALAGRIRERAVVTRTMPPANRTRITDAERALLGRWVERGGAVR